MRQVAVTGVGLSCLLGCALGLAPTATNGQARQGEDDRLAVVRFYASTRSSITHERPLLVLCDAGMTSVVTPAWQGRLRSWGFVDSVVVDPGCKPRPVTRVNGAVRPVLLLQRLTMVGDSATVEVQARLSGEEIRKEQALLVSKPIWHVVSMTFGQFEQELPAGSRP